MSDAERTLRWCAVTLRPMLLDAARVDSCILTTRVAIEVMHYAGHKAARPLAVKVIAANREAQEELRAGRMPDEWPEAAWSVGVQGTGSRASGRWDGHLIVACGDVLADLTADQFHRPDKGLPCPGPIVVTGWDRTWPVLTANDDTGVAVRYEPMRGEAAQSFRHAPDWLTNHRALAAGAIAAWREAAPWHR